MGYSYYGYLDKHKNIKNLSGTKNDPITALIKLTALVADEKSIKLKHRETYVERGGKHIESPDYSIYVIKPEILFSEDAAIEPRRYVEGICIKVDKLPEIPLTDDNLEELNRAADLYFTDEGEKAAWFLKYELSK